MNKGLVSVIIPVYNSEKYLHRCINSIVYQTYKDLEIILVNDGSTDSSLQICNNASLHDSRIICISQSNKGATEARKTGIKKASGRWIMFVDSDDSIERDSIERLLQHDNGHRQIIAGTLNLISNDKTHSQFYHKKYGDLTSQDYISALLLNETSVGPVAKLIDRNLFKKIKWNIPSDIIQNEDLLMLLELTKNIEGGIYVTNDIICYNYYFRNNSISKSAIMSIGTWIKVFDYIKQHIITNNDIFISREFFLYKLRRLYDCCILKGVNIEKYRQYIDNLISESSSYTLAEDDYMIVSIIKSPIKTYILTIWNRFKWNVKYIIRKTYLI